MSQTQAITVLHPAIPPITDTTGLGKAMIALNPQQRAFVFAYVETGGQDATRAALMAGYSMTNDNARRVTAHRLAHDPRVQAAIKEVADARLRQGAILGAEVLIAIAGDPTHKDRMKAAVELLNRSGLLVTPTVNHVHRSEDDVDRVQRIVNMATQLGLDPRELLGSAGVTVDAEFKVVQNGGRRPAPPQPEEVVDAEVIDEWGWDPEEDAA